MRYNHNSEKNRLRNQDSKRQMIRVRGKNMSHKGFSPSSTVVCCDCGQTQGEIQHYIQNYQLLNWQLYDGKKRT